MRLAQTFLTLACLIGLVTGPWASSAVQAQPASPGVTREGTIVSINRQDASFVMSTKDNPPRELTVHAQKFTEITVAGQSTHGSFGNLAVGDYVVVHMLTLASGQVLAVTTHVVSRAPAAGLTTGPKQTAAASRTSGAPSRAGSSGSGLSVGVSGNGSSTGAGVSVGVNGRGSARGSGVSVDASGRGSAGNGVSVDASGRGSGGKGVSVDASGRGSGGGNGASADSGGRGSGGGNGASVDVGGRVEVSTR